MPGWLLVASHDCLHLFLAHSYLTLFVLVLLEEAGCILPLPVESLLVVAGARLVRGQMSTGLLLGAVLPASAIGCGILYAVARVGGRRLLLRLGARLHLNDAKLNAAEARLVRLGPPAVLMGRITPGLRVPTGAAAGVFRVPPVPCLLWALVATCLRVAFFLYIGATAQHLGLAIVLTRRAWFVSAALILALAICGGLLWRRRLHARQRLASTPAVG
ncbi:MAG: DedA family protein [Chloroflexota bacterium]